MPSDSTWVTPLVKQIWIASSVLCSMLGTGMMIGFTSCLLPALQAPDSDIEISAEASSWLVACLAIFSIFGIFISSILMDVCGRRKAFGLDLLPGIAGLLMTCYAPNVFCLIAGRALAGLCSGSTTTLAAVVIGEYTSPEYRPTFLNLKTAFLFVGSTIVHILGHYVQWRTVAVIMTIPLIIALVMVYTWPESPSWLAGKKMYEQSEWSFFWFRERTTDSIKEIKDLIHAQRDKTAKITISEKVLDFLKKFTKKNFLKPVITYVFAAVLLESSGRHYFPAYAAQIVKEIAGDTPNAFSFTLIVDIIISGSAIFSSYLVKIMKIRTLLFTTGFISFIILMLACLYLFLLSTGVISKDYPWAPMSIFALYFIFVNFGCAPIPLALVGELFPLEHRAVGSLIAGCIIAILMTIVFKIMPLMLTNLKIYGTFSVFGIAIAVSLVVLYFMLPETKNRTLQEIDDYFSYGKFKNNSDQDNEVIESLVDGKKSPDSV